MNNYKKSLIDTPVKLNIWIRPDCKRRQFEVIKNIFCNVCSKSIINNTEKHGKKLR